jgi:hypothetical protein
MDEIKPPTIEELEEQIELYEQYANKLKELLAIEQVKSRELDTENSGWLAVYRRIQSENAGLKAEISRLESRLQDGRSGS